MENLVFEIEAENDEQAVDIALAILLAFSEEVDVEEGIDE
jgi:hypothetical protein